MWLPVSSSWLKVAPLWTVLRFIVSSSGLTPQSVDPAILPHICRNTALIQATTDSFHIPSTSSIIVSPLSTVCVVRVIDKVIFLSSSCLLRQRGLVVGWSTFRANISIPSTRFMQSEKNSAWPWDMGQVVLPESSLTDYEPKLLNILFLVSSVDVV